MDPAGGNFALVRLSNQIDIERYWYRHRSKGINKEWQKIASNMAKLRYVSFYIVILKLKQEDGGMAELTLGGVVIPQDEVMKADLLRIDVIEGPEVNRDTSLEINAQGLIGSKRAKNDGCTILGSLS